MVPMTLPPWPPRPAEDDDDKYAAGNARLRQAVMVLSVLFALVLIVWYALRFVDALGEPDAPVQPTQVAAPAAPAGVPTA